MGMGSEVNGVIPTPLTPLQWGEWGVGSGVGMGMGSGEWCWNGWGGGKRGFYRLPNLLFIAFFPLALLLRRPSMVVVLVGTACLWWRPGARPRQLAGSREFGDKEVKEGRKCRLADIKRSQEGGEEREFRKTKEGEEEKVFFPGCAN